VGFNSPPRDWDWEKVSPPNIAMDRKSSPEDGDGKPSPDREFLVVISNTLHIVR
jgi:hypothetical protein